MSPSFRCSIVLLTVVGLLAVACGDRGPAGPDGGDGGAALGDAGQGDGSDGVGAGDGDGGRGGGDAVDAAVDLPAHRGCVTDEQGCQDCLAAHCDMEATVCYGSDWVADETCAYPNCPIVVNPTAAVQAYVAMTRCLTFNCATPCQAIPQM